MAFVQQLGDDLEKTKDELSRTKTFLATKDRAAKPNKPSLFFGKSGTIEAWCSHMDAYVSGSEPAEACRIACTYLDGEAFTWWQSYSAATSVPDWDTLRTCLIRRFNPLNKVQALQQDVPQHRDGYPRHHGVGKNRPLQPWAEASDLGTSVHPNLWQP